MVVALAMDGKGSDIADGNSNYSSLHSNLDKTSEWGYLASIELQSEGCNFFISLRDEIKLMQ